MQTLDKKANRILSESPKDKKKRLENATYYFKNNQQKLLLDRHGKPFKEFIYEVTPLQDFQILQLNHDHLVRNNIYVDRQNYLGNMKSIVYSYFNESTEKLVDKETLKLHVIPYDHNCFEAMLMMKIVAVQNYSIPMILEFHYERYLNPSHEKRNSKGNKKKFVDLLEFRILQRLHSSSPFDYVDKGFTIAGWLREKRRKLKNQWPFETRKDNIAGEEENMAFDLLQDMNNRTIEKFKTLEENLLKCSFIIKTDDGKFKWNRSITEIIAMVLLMNENNYFKENLLDSAKKKLKKTVFSSFEERYDISFGQAVEPARINAIQLSKYRNLKPFHLIKIDHKNKIDNSNDNKD